MSQLENSTCERREPSVPLLSTLCRSQSVSGGGPMSPRTLPQVQGGEGGGGSAVSGDSRRLGAGSWGGATGVTGRLGCGVGVLLPALPTFSLESSATPATMSEQPTVRSRSPLRPDLVVRAVAACCCCRDTFSLSCCLARLVRTTSSALWLSSKLADLGRDLKYKVSK